MGISKDSALQVIFKALESKAITLGGPSSGETPTKAGQADAEYINALLKGLTDQQHG